MALGKNSFLTVAFLLFFICGACSTSGCRKYKNYNADHLKNSGAQELQKEIDQTNAINFPSKVKVYKYDGSKQCGLDKGIKLEEMEKQLKGIKIYKEFKKNDGLVRVMACGTPTGNANVYEISSKDLEKAKKLGFKIWAFH
ncbi:MAG: hypothetical protein D6797_01475 [Bdellovibrio sp.]|nr:MAG: hypothetical protein D6797_01475 [Bdellovibrio sp.]